MYNRLLSLCLCSALSLILVSAQQRWHLNEEGGITWRVDLKMIPHKDHIEMSGLRVSTVVRYGVDEAGEFFFNRGMVWPMLRTVPNDTHASLMRKLGWNPIENVLIDNIPLKEKVKSISLDGILRVESIVRLSQGEGLTLIRELFPSVTLPAFCEKYTLINHSDRLVTVEIGQVRNEIITAEGKGVNGSYRIVQTLEGEHLSMLYPDESLSFYAATSGWASEEMEIKLNIEQELLKRKSFVDDIQGNLILGTPDSVLNTMFSFAKIRASESIYDTECGLLHSPGGESYYAAIWANDEAEYIGPFFPYLGYDKGNQATLNAYMQFARFMNDDYKPLPSSIIAEGKDIWAGAGDRGDAAMIAYGASRYALACGNKEDATCLWPLIEWCLEYCRRKLNKEGVVTSDSDELEGRFPAGKANLCTSSLYYDALNSAVYLGKELGKNSSILKNYAQEAKKLKLSIENYFGAEIEGFNTYQYYQGNKVLRSWICMPLTVGIFERKDETIRALFSPQLWTDNGLLTQAGSETFWDRSTLYALRGVFACGETERALDYLSFYSRQRLLGNHVPYAIEAWPEGNQRHLSAESGLYCRIITEGMFGIRPTGFRSFVLTPRMPLQWMQMSLKNIRIFGKKFDILVEREDKKVWVTVSSKDRIYLKESLEEGDSVKVTL